MTLIDDIIGPLAIGAWFSCWFYGMELMMAWTYFSRYKHDHWLLVVGVVIALLADTFGTILNCVMVYNYAITNFGNTAILAYQGWYLSIAASTVAVCGLMSQSYLIYRLCRFCKKWWPGVPLVACSLANSCLVSYGAWSVMHFTDHDHLKNIGVAYLSLGVAVDGSVAFGLIFFLWKHIRETPFAQTRALLFKVMFMSIESGLVTTSMVALCVILLLKREDTNDVIGLAMALGRIYSLTLFVNLNFRGTSGGKLDSSFNNGSNKTPSYMLKTVGPQHTTNQDGRPLAGTHSVTVNVEHAVQMDRDAGSDYEQKVDNGRAYV